MRRNASATTHTQLTITGFKPAEFNLNFELPELKRTPNVFFMATYVLTYKKSLLLPLYPNV